jgi:hypothetical protein
LVEVLLSAIEPELKAGLSLSRTAPNTAPLARPFLIAMWALAPVALAVIFQNIV